MECLGIDWDGIPHSSIADTYACMRVWEKLFPNYYDTEAPATVLTGMPAEEEATNV